jgi:hypothetical protein
MKHNKIIFLDVDGVINIPPYDNFDKRCMDNLWKIVKQTGAKIVVSSSWRTGNLQLTKEALMGGGFYDVLLDEIVGETIRKWDFTVDGSYLKIVRGNEIGTWVDRNLRYPWHENKDMHDQYAILNEDGSFQKMRSNVLGKDYSYVILDDDNDMLFCQRNHFIHTNGYVGIEDSDVGKAIHILNQIDNAPPQENGMDSLQSRIDLLKRTNDE